MLDKIKKYSWAIDALLGIKWSTKKEVISHFLMAKKKYIPKEKTNANVGDILKCALCPNMCRFDCPVLRVEKSEALSPSGKTRIAYFLEMNKLNFTSDFIDLMYKCAGCDACKQWCPFDFSVGDLLLGVREDIIERGLAPSPLVEFKDELEKNHTIYEETPVNAGIEIKKERADILYFRGCTAKAKTPEVVDANLKILKKSGVEFTTLPDEWCCGVPFLILGFKDAFKEFAEHNVKAIKESKCKTLVCGCPECTYVFKELYPKLGFRLKAEILPMAQFLLRLVEEKRIKPMSLKEEYVYHDPCVLSRKLNVCAQPRELLKSIPGLKLKEAHFSQKETRCCGMGGMLGITNPKISLEIAKNRISELGEAGDSVVTACPTCELAFKNADKKLKILDLSEVLLKSLEK
jgi:Fe-S oxidoreductase